MALQNTFYFDVDFKQKTYVKEPQVTQNDEVTFVLRVFDDGYPFSLTDISTYALVSQRKDKQSVLTNGVKTADNEITFTLGTTELTVPGKVKAAIQLYDVGGRVSSIPFTYTVLDDLSSGYVPSVDEQTLIELVLGEGPAILAGAEAATITANNAADNADAKAQLADTAASTANTAATNADAKALLADQKATLASNSAADADWAKSYAENAAQDAQIATDAINAVLPNVQGLENKGEYNNATTYAKNNVVERNGSSWQALQNTTGNTPPTLPTKSNAFWMLLAQRGIDGTGSVSSVNGVGPDVNGDVQITIPDPDLSGLATKNELQKLDDEVTLIFNNMGRANVKDFGAKGDGTTDDTLAIRNAISSLTIGGILFFPPGEYIVSQIDSNNYVFLINKPIKIVGCGFVSSIRLKTGTPNNCDLFYVNPNMDFGGEFYGVENLLIYPKLNTDGRYAFHFDVSQTGKYMNKFYMSDVYIQQHGSNAIRVTNAENKPDGFFSSTFERCSFFGGVELERTGDGIVFRDCTFTGRGRGIRVKSVSIPNQGIYASQFILDNCNLTSDGGALLVEFAKNITIIGGNIEQTKPFNGAVIDIAGNTNEVINFNMEKTHLTVFGSSGAGCNNLRLGNVNHASVAKCVFANETGGKNIVIDSLAKNVAIGSMNVFEVGVNVLDSGVGTIGVRKTPTLLNGWSNFNSQYYSTVSYIKDERGFVHVKGLIKDGVSTNGTILFNFPAGFRPSRITPFFVFSDASGVLGTAELRVLDNGDLVAQALNGNTRVSLDGISFLAE